MSAAAAAEPKRCVHPQLWQACAGPLCAVPLVGAEVFYFPKGHAEHAVAAVDLPERTPAFVPCRVTDVNLMAEPDTDDIYAKMSLHPLLRPYELVADVGDAIHPYETVADVGDAMKTDGSGSSFAKTLTNTDVQRDLFVPKACVLSVFPKLDYRLHPPVRFVSATDVHGVDWTFRYIYRRNAAIYLLTFGWRDLVRNKKLQASDSVVFIREEDGKIHVGLRRGKQEFVSHGGGDAGSLAGAAAAGPSDCKVLAEDVVTAARLAAAGKPFEVVHYPRASAPEFCVGAAAVKESMETLWCPGLRFKMAFEMKDVSPISWFLGTVASVGPADPARWPESPWRLLQVIWDFKSERLRNVKRVCPWWVKPVLRTELDPALPLPPNHDREDSHGLPSTAAAVVIQGGASSNDLQLSQVPTQFQEAHARSPTRSHAELFPDDPADLQHPFLNNDATVSPEILPPLPASSLIETGGNSEKQSFRAAAVAGSMPAAAALTTGGGQEDTMPAAAALTTGDNHTDNAADAGGLVYDFSFVDNDFNSIDDIAAGAGDGLFGDFSFNDD